MQFGIEIGLSYICSIYLPFKRVMELILLTRAIRIDDAKYILSSIDLNEGTNAYDQLNSTLWRLMKEVVLPFQIKSELFTNFFDSSSHISSGGQFPWL